MEFFAETSFLFAIYIEQNNSATADEFLDYVPSGSPLSALVRFEFENGLRLQAGLFERDRSKGLALRFAEAAQMDLSADLERRFWEIRAVDLAEILHLARKLSEAHTQKDLQRPMDILHVATALRWGAKSFLTFDARQTKLAKAAGMKCPLKVS
jgi:predicted nucleic acid-binding protein